MPALTATTLPAVGERVPTPTYDRARVKAGVAHIGVGGFHRAHQAMYHDRLLAEGEGLDWGICGVGVLPGDRAMRDALAAQDHLYTLVLKHDDGALEPRVIGSIVDYLYAPDDRAAVVERMAEPAIRIVSMTITESGYDVGAAGSKGASFELVLDALGRRRARGVPPFTVMSCDNLNDNGDVARTALCAVARARDPELADWIGREVAFPSSMVDRITPRTTDADRRALHERFGVADRWPVVCEPYAQWVLEDDFPAGRPPYERAGVQLVGDVGPYELMKMRLLNGGHQAIAYFAYLSGHRLVHEAARDDALRRFLRAYMSDEVAPTLPPVPGVDLGSYQGELLRRFANPAIGDTVARLCERGSDLIPVFVLPVIRERLARGQEVTRGAAIVASWARYSEGSDERGEPIEIVDRRRESLTERARRQRDDPAAFIADRELFGDLADQPGFTDPYRAALASLQARGARATLAAMALG